MKKYLLIIALAVMGLTGCNKLVEAVDPIVGQWHCYSFDTIYPDGHVDASLSIEWVLVINEDGTCKYATTDMEWEKNGNTLSLKLPNYTKGTTYTIEELNHDRLVLLQDLQVYKWRFVLTRDK